MHRASGPGDAGEAAGSDTSGGSSRQAADNQLSISSSSSPPVLQCSPLTCHRSPHVMNQSAFSAKLQALQARDKALRESRERQTDIETATAVTGCCPDMCPELERLFREETNQLSSLEMAGGQPDVYAMVKEYRRAGADQSEPLPHELRPGPILKRTLDYLMCNVMDRVQDDAAIRNEWYDFLWSRTRAIRKDITQQHLCDTGSVDLLEKCTRFHIHCAASLVEEDTTVFDPKINDENLRKCMQSLKDFYHDLAVTQAITCPNEAEFRAYDILMNLQDSDILREIKHLRKDIIDSPQVKFAIAAYFALSSNNYIRFFQLVQNTNYLNACLLHRFFGPVRVTAVRLLRRAFTTQKSPYLCPDEDFARQLGFDDMKQVSILCESLALRLENGYICLSRDEGEMRDAPAVSPLRSQSLVECKRTTSIGEVVNGGPLPESPYKKYPIHTSFDDYGNLKPNALASITPEKKAIDMFSPFGGSFTHPAAPPAPLFGMPAASSTLETGFSFLRQAQQFSHQPADDQRSSDITDGTLTKTAFGFVDDAIDEVAADMIVASVKQVFEEARREAQVQSLLQLVLDDGLGRVIREIASKEYSLALEVKHAADLRKRVVETSYALADDIIASLVRQEVRGIASRVVRKAQTGLLDRTSQALADKVLTLSLKLLLAELLQSVIRDAEQERDRKVEEMREKRKQRLAMKYLMMWIAFLKNRKFSRLKQSFPASSLEAGNSVQVVVNVESKKRPSSVRKSAVKKKQKVVTPPASQLQLRRSPRSTMILNNCREQIRLASDKSPGGRMTLLTTKLKEEKEKGLRNDQLVGTVTRALVYTEDSYE